LSEGDDLIERLKQLPGNRPAKEREGAKELKEPGSREEKARSLLNYPEVQKAFVDLAKSQASLQLLEEENRELQRNLQDAGEEAERTRQELKAKEAEVIRLNSVLKQKDDEIRVVGKKRKAAEADHREKDQLVKERDKALTLVEERPVVEKIVKQYVNDYSAPRVFMIGLVIGLGAGAIVVYLLPFLASLLSS
jgi:chromosome segregation ATPase